MDTAQVEQAPAGETILHTTLEVVTGLITDKFEPLVAKDRDYDWNAMSEDFMQRLEDEGYWIAALDR